MGRITLENVRASSDITLKVRLKDGNMNIAWTSLSDIRAYIYSDEQKAIAGRCDISVDGNDSTLLICEYAATKPQYLGVNSIIIRAKYDGRVKAYDRGAFNIVPRTFEASGSVVLQDPVVDVEIRVEDVSTSLLDKAITLAFKAVEEWNQATITERGPQGIGIENMVQTSESSQSGGTNVWKAVMTDGTEYEFHVKNGAAGSGLASVEQTTVSTEDEGVNVVTFTMDDGTEQTVEIRNGSRGPVGATPDIRIGTVTTGAAGSPASASMTGTPEAPVLNITIPQGIQGNPGSSVEYPFELVNNETTDDATKAHTAAGAKRLKDELAQLDEDLDDNVELLERGLELISTPEIQVATKLQMNEGNYIIATSSSSLKIKYIPVVKGDIVRMTGTNGTALNLRYGICESVPADGVYINQKDLFNGTVLDLYVTCFVSGYFSVYTTGFSDLSFDVLDENDLGEKVKNNTDNGKFLLNAFGITDVIPAPICLFYKGFVIYSTGNTNSDSETLKWTSRINVQGWKYIFFPLHVSTGTGSAGCAFYDENGEYISGVRQITSASEVSYKNTVLTIPENAKYFRNTVHVDNLDHWFCFLTNNPNIEKYNVVWGGGGGDDPDNAPADIRYTMRVLGITDYEEIVPSGWNDGHFIYWDNGTSSTSANLSYTTKCYTEGKKFLFFTQNVSAGTGRSGIAFYDAENTYISGIRQFISAPEAGYRPIVVEIPANTSYFRATINIDSKEHWFAYVTDNEKAVSLINETSSSESSVHLKICLLGNSYTADAWRYVPSMLLQYGITCECNFYYRGSGSLWDLDDQWENTSQYDVANIDGTMHVRLHYKCNSRSGSAAWSSATRASAKSIVAADKYDIISVQQAGKQCKTPSLWIPYLQDVIDKIMAECDYPFSLCLFEAYSGAVESSDASKVAASLTTQHDFYKKYPFTMLMPAAAAVFSAQGNETLAALGDSTYHRLYADDDTHLQEGLPCYIAACVVVQSILDKYMPGKSVLNDQFRATAENIANLGMNPTANGESTGVTEGNCYLAQKAAIAACKNPFEITEI